MMLKYELETNVNLVSFALYKIEISFNEKLNKDFLKVLSTKLLEWTNNRWIIAISQTKGNISKKDEKILEISKENDIFVKSKDYEVIKNLIEDVELGKKMTDFSKILNKAKELENNMKESQQRIKKIEAEGVSGGDKVKITLNGNNEIVKISISPDILREDISVLEDLICAAHNNAKETLKSKTAEEISKVTGEFGIPGFKWPL